jgi:hypothetical protein
MPANFSPIVRRSIQAVQLASVEKKRVKDLKNTAGLLVNSTNQLIQKDTLKIVCFMVAEH